MAPASQTTCLTGVIGDRPAATAVPAGTLYASTDEDLIYQSDGTTWADWLEPAPASAAGKDHRAESDRRRHHPHDRRRQTHLLWSRWRSTG